MRLAKMRHGAMAMLPRGLRLDRPVTQLFINDDRRKTKYTLTNYPALLSPQTAESCTYKVTMWNSHGQRVAKATFELAPHGSIEVNPETAFERAALPALGMVSVRLKPKSSLSYNDRHLGVLSSHFYALYHTPDMSSVALVHPQSKLHLPTSTVENWISAHVLEPSALKSIDAYAINSATEACHMTFGFRSTGDSVKMEKQISIASRGAGLVTWTKSELPTEAFSLTMRGLIPHNVKPLVFLNFDDGSFAASHG